MSINKSPSHSIPPLEMALMTMAFLSVIVLMIPTKLLKTHLELNPPDYPAVLVNDHHIQGKSEVGWLDKSAQRWECTLKEGYDAPFCSLQISVVNAQDEGLDLSRFDTMTLWADYQGEGSHMRVYLRNRDPKYYVPENDMSTKYNMVEVSVRHLEEGLSIRMEDFNVAGWWLIAGDIPLADSQPRFDDVAIIEIQTGSMVRTGTHAFQIKKIVWTGNIVSRATLYQAVIILWIVFIFLILGYRLLRMRRELRLQRSYQQELLTINEALNLENRRYEDMAKTDALTGLRNRVGIRDLLHQSLIDWRDQGTPFSCIIIDLDNFKRINDTYGHAAGDQVLIEAAQLMLNRVRRTDALARWGGEEFVLACPHTPLSDAMQVAENLRFELEKNLNCNGTPITASFGVAHMTQPSLAALFKKADTALYQAKKQGRNRVCSEP